MDVSNCLYDPAEEISLPEFHRKYLKSLPMLVVVLGGYDGTTEYDDTPSDTIIRYNNYQSVRRGLALDPKTRRNYISIPLISKYKFNVIKSVATKKEDHTLAHILENNPLPVLIQFSESKDIPTEGRNKEGKPYQFLITHVYEEVFIQGNFITDGKIMKQASSFSLCPIISVAPVKGFTDRTQKKFDEYLQKLKQYVHKNTVFSENQCDLSIKELAPDAAEIIDVLNPKDSKSTAASTTPPPPPVRGKSLKKPRDSEEDDDGEAYEVMENPEGEIDTYRVADNPPSYVNDRLCWVKPLSSEPSAEIAGDSKHRDSGELYEPMKDPGDYLEPQKHIESKPVPVKPEDSKPVPTSRLPPKPKKKPEKRQPYENSHPLSDEKEPPVLPPPPPPNKESEGSGEVKCTESKTPCSFCIEEKSIQDIVHVLSLLRLNKYAERFQEEMVDGEILAGLSVEDLQSEFGFSKLEALRLYRYIEKGHVPK